MKNKGFTLIELLAVIIILGILMLIAIPSVSNYVNSSRKNTYVTTINELVKGVIAKSSNGELKMLKNDTTYYVPTTCIKLENGEASSPNGKFDPAYVAVTFDHGKYNYYFTGRDVNNSGVAKPTRIDLISNDSIENNISTIDTSIGIDGRAKIVVFNEDCSEVAENKISTMMISGEGEVLNNALYIPDNTCKKQKCPKSITPVIYWALQDTDSDGTNDKLIISNKAVDGNKKGSFAGDTVFSGWHDVPWGVSGSMLPPREPSQGKAYYVTNVTVEGEVAPLSIAYWFPAVGWGSDKLIMNLENLKTCHVTNMSHAFIDVAGGDELTIKGLCSWDTSNVENMNGMFHATGNNASKWDIGNISIWDTSKVTDMGGMFVGAADKSPNFIIDLSYWDTSSVTDMSDMFFSTASRATTWNIGDIGSWDTSNVTNMNRMFYTAGENATSWYIGNKLNWNVSKVIDFELAFGCIGYRAENLDLDLSNWNLSSASNVRSMFNAAGANATTVNLNLDNWKTSSVTSMSEMFKWSGDKSKSFNLSMSNWDTSNVTDMSEMFFKTGNYAQTWSVGNIDNWNTSNVTTMNNMFKYAGYNSSSFNFDLSGWDTSKVTDMREMFSSAGTNAKTWTVGNISNWNTSNVTDMYGLFWGAGSYATTINLDISNWNTSKVTNLYNAFLGTGSKATSFNITIPKTNGNGVDNTTTCIYGKDLDVHTDPPTNKQFTLAS